MTSAMETLGFPGHGDDRQEMDLVLQTLRALISGESSSLLASLAGPVDWEAVERIAESHSVMPAVAYALREYGGDAAPVAVRDRLKERLLLASRSNLALIAEWCRALEAFDQADIPVISLKGPALALLVYPNFAVREFTDLDLLVRSCDVPRASDSLLAEGYRVSSAARPKNMTEQVRSRNRQIEFVHDQRHIRVDLHWGALHEMFSFQLPPEVLFESARREHYEGIRFLALSPENLLLYLCAHGAKHCWLNLRWVCDVAFQIKKCHDLDWESCIRTAEASKCALVLKHSLILVREVLGIELPSLVADYCRDVQARAVADRAAELLFRGNRDLSHGQELGFHLAFASGWRDRGRFLFERLFVPDEPDLRSNLPGFLSYAAKPMRFLFTRLRSV